MVTMPAAIARLLALPDDQKLVVGLEDALIDKARRDGLESLSSIQWHVLLAVRAAGIVGGGGFKELFEQDDPRAEETVAALDAIGAHEAAAWLNHALTVFPGGRPPADRNERLQHIELLSDSERRKFTRGEPHVGAFVLDRLVAEYARRHRSAFADLPAPTRITWPLRAPAADAPGRVVATWVQSLGGTVAFDGDRDDEQRRFEFEPGFELPDGPLTLREVELPGSRRDLDQILAWFAAWSGVDMLEAVSLESAFHLTRKGMATIASFPGLRRLAISHAPIDDEGLGQLASCSTLADLSLRRLAAVTGAGLARLEPLAITRLELDDMAIGTALKHFPRLRSCTILGVLGDAELRFLEFAVELEELTLMRVALHREAITRISRSTALRELMLWHVGLGEADLAPLAGHAMLARLHMEGLRLTAAGARTLVTLPALRWLMVPGTEIDAEARRILRAGLPAAELHVR